MAKNNNSVILDKPEELSNRITIFNSKLHRYFDQVDKNVEVSIDEAISFEKDMDELISKLILAKGNISRSIYRGLISSKPRKITIEV